LDEFVWAYHLNRLTGGALISIATIVGSTLLFLVLEQFGRFGIAGRTVIFWFLIVGSAAVLARWVVWPLALLFQLRKGLTYEAASEIIGIHFPEISDRLLNVLQLQRQLQGSDASEDLSLLNASIEERTETLRAVPFKKAVNWTESTRLIRYAMPPVAIVIVLFSWKPQWVQEPAERILSHRQDFIPPPPFSFEILNERLAVPAAQAFSVEVQTKGEQLPSVVVLESSGQRYRMEKKKRWNVSSHLSSRPRNNRFRADCGWSEVTKLHARGAPHSCSSIHRGNFDTAGIHRPEKGNTARRWKPQSTSRNSNPMAISKQRHRESSNGFSRSNYRSACRGGRNLQCQSLNW
jgi:hypothetical protein